MLTLLPSWRNWCQPERNEPYEGLCIRSSQRKTNGSATSSRAICGRGCSVLNSAMMIMMITIAKRKPIYGPWSLRASLHTTQPGGGQQRAVCALWCLGPWLSLCVSGKPWLLQWLCSTVVLLRGCVAVLSCAETLYTELACFEETWSWTQPVQTAVDLVLLCYTS